MARPTSAVPTDSERAILEVLWRNNEASVREVVDELSKKKPTAYTTILTLLRIMERKGLVSHRSEGRAFIYSASIRRAKARRQALENLLKQFFNGSPSVLAQHLINEHDIDPDELKALRQRVDAPPVRSRK